MLAKLLAGKDLKLADVEGVELRWYREKKFSSRYSTRDFDEAEDMLIYWASSCWPLTVTLEIGYRIYFTNGLIFDSHITCDHYGLSLDGQTLREHLRDSLLSHLDEAIHSPDREPRCVCRADVAAGLNAYRILRECRLPGLWG